jgi:beta-lactam-binding protein with PASTA domain
VRCLHCGFENDDTARFCANRDCRRYLPRAAEPPEGDAAAVEPVEPVEPVAPTVPARTVGPGARQDRPAPVVDAPAVVSPVSGPAGPARLVPPTAREPQRYSLTRSRPEPVQVQTLDQPSSGAGPPDGSASRSADGRQGLMLLLEGADATVEPGEEHIVRVRVHNTGSVVERVDLRISGAPHTWAAFEPPQMNLDQGDEGVTLLHLKPPRVAGTGSGPAPYTVDAWSMVDPTVRVAVTGRVVVAPFSDVSLVVDPPVMATRRRAVVRITAANDGNAAVPASIDAVDAERRLRIHPAHEEVDLGPGQRTTVDLQVNVRRRRLVGGPVPHRLTVRLQPRGGPAAEAGVVVTQLPLLPRWAPKVGAAVAAVVASGVLVMAWTWWQTLPRPVPAVEGRRLDQAQTLLAEQDLVGAVSGEVADQRPKDVVVSQDPTAGHDAAGHSKVSLVVSTGPDPIEVVKVYGLPRDDAERTLKARGFDVRYDDGRSDDTVPAGLVIAQVPLDGEKAMPGSIVRLTLSTGLPQVLVPQVAQRSFTAATEELLKSQLGWTTEPDGVTQGVVTGQSPAAGTKVDKGTKVTLVVSPPPAAPTPAAPP